MTAENVTSYPLNSVINSINIACLLCDCAMLSANASKVRAAQQWEINAVCECFHLLNCFI